MFPGLIVSWHHLLVEKYLLMAFEGVIKKLLIREPPRHTKSLMVSRAFPAWFFGKRPTKEVIQITYGDELAKDHGRVVRNWVNSPRYQGIFPGVKLAQDSKSANRFNTNQGGVYVSVGIGGPVTGRGADLLSIDDPYKDRMEADSKATLKAVWDFYEAVAYTRMQPGAVQILTTTNWGDACLDQKLIREGKKNNDPWTVLDLPALIEPDYPKMHPEDPRKEGEALWPERYGVEALKKIKVNVGPRNWAALYQQKPIPDGGSIIAPAWLKRYDALPNLRDFDKIYFSCDLTFKETDDGSFVVYQVWATKGSQFWLLDQVRKRMGYVDCKKELFKLIAKWPMALLKLVEDKANGSALKSDLELTVPGIVMVEPEGDKVNRLNGVSPYFAAGNVYIPASGLCSMDETGQRWIDTWVEELTRFPVSEFDDQVDATSQALAFGHLSGADTFAAQAQ